jgi:hypothetical protein
MLQFFVDSLYWIGGKTDNADMKLYKYSLASNTWSVVSTINTPTYRYYGGSALHNSVLYLLPGYDNSGATVTDIYSLDLSKSNPEWLLALVSQGADLLSRNSYGVAQYKNLAWMLCGWVDGVLNNDLIYIDFSSSPLKVSTVSEASLNPKARFDHSMEIVNNKLYIFGGRNQDSL